MRTGTCEVCGEPDDGRPTPTSLFKDHWVHAEHLDSTTEPGEPAEP